MTSKNDKYQIFRPYQSQNPQYSQYKATIATVDKGTVIEITIGFHIGYLDWNPAHISPYAHTKPDISKIDQNIRSAP